MANLKKKRKKEKTFIPIYEIEIDYRMLVDNNLFGLTNYLWFEYQASSIL